MVPIGSRCQCGDSPFDYPGDLEGDVDGSFASGDEEVLEVPVVEMVPPVRASGASMRAGFVGLDDWNLEELFSHRGSLMRSVPRFLWIFPRGNKVGVGRDSAWSGTRERVATRARVEVFHVARVLRGTHHFLRASPSSLRTNILEHPSFVVGVHLFFASSAKLRGDRPDHNGDECCGSRSQCTHGASWSRPLPRGAQTRTPRRHRECSK